MSRIGYTKATLVVILAMFCGFLGHQLAFHQIGNDVIRNRQEILRNQEMIDELVEDASEWLMNFKKDNPGIKVPKPVKERKAANGR